MADLLPEMDSCRMEKQAFETANGKDAEGRARKGSECPVGPSEACSTKPWRPLKMTVKVTKGH